LDQLVSSFDWSEARATLAALASECSLEAHSDGRVWKSADGTLEVELPGVLAPPSDTRGAGVFALALPEAPGLHALLLLRAGAAALGLWDDDELLAHKTITKYVVRGKGRAQPTHLKTRGKSRHGSRLRLRNAEALLVEVSERLGDWWAEFGPFDQLLYAAPVRQWSDLFHVKPAPPCERKGLPRRVGVDVREPRHEELLRVRRLLGRGRILRSEGGPSARDDARLSGS